MPFVGGWEDFTVRYQFFPTAREEEYSLMVASTKVMRSRHNFFSLVLTRKSSKLSSDREPKIVTRRKGCQRCVLSPPSISFVVKS